MGKKDIQKVDKKNDNQIYIDCGMMNSKATIELASKVLEIIKKDYDSLVNIKVVANTD